MFNFSAESIAYSFSLLFAKQISSGQITKAFYLPHLFIFIANLLIVPLIVGFYVGRHSDNRRLANVVLVILFDMGYNLLSVSLFPVNLYLLSFLSFIMYMSFPIVLAMAYIGAIIGRFFPGNSDKSLYLTIYNEILARSKKGLLFLCFVSSHFLLSEGFRSPIWIHQILP